MNNAKAQNFLDEIDMHGEDLTDWEIDFVNDMLKKTDDENYTPTPKEAYRIKQIYSERVN
ncbi:MAG: hypothetical protein F6K48_03110 [Okeania sp. SIO3H1]|nr:hypothetical protein [Okeania sp. SIO3H1]